MSNIKIGVQLDFNSSTGINEAKSQIEKFVTDVQTTVSKIDIRLNADTDQVISGLGEVETKLNNLIESIQTKIGQLSNDIILSVTLSKIKVGGEDKSLQQFLDFFGQKTLQVDIKTSALSNELLEILELVRQKENANKVTLDFEIGEGFKESFERMLETAFNDALSKVRSNINKAKAELALAEKGVKPTSNMVAVVADTDQFKAKIADELKDMVFQARLLPDLTAITAMLAAESPKFRIEVQVVENEQFKSLLSFFTKDKRVIGLTVNAPKFEDVQTKLNELTPVINAGIAIDSNAVQQLSQSLAGVANLDLSKIFGSEDVLSGAFGNLEDEMIRIARIFADEINRALGFESDNASKTVQRSSRSKKTENPEIAAAAQELQSAREELAKIGSSFSADFNVKDDFDTRIESIKKTIDAGKSALDQKRNDLLTVQNEIDGIVKNFSSVSQENNAQEIKKLQEIIKANREAIEENSRAARKGTFGDEDSLTDKDLYLKENRKLTLKNKELSEKISQLKEDQENISNADPSLDVEFRLAKAELKSTQKEIAQIEQQLAGLESELKSLEAAQQSAMDSTGSFSQKQKEAQERVEALTKSLEELRATALAAEAAQNKQAGSAKKTSANSNLSGLAKSISDSFANSPIKLSVVAEIQNLQTIKETLEAIKPNLTAAISIDPQSVSKLSESTQILSGLDLSSIFGEQSVIDTALTGFENGMRRIAGIFASEIGTSLGGVVNAAEGSASQAVQTNQKAAGSKAKTPEKVASEIQNIEQGLKTTVAAVEAGLKTAAASNKSAQASKTSAANSLKSSNAATKAAIAAAEAADAVISLVKAIIDPRSASPRPKNTRGKSNAAPATEPKISSKKIEDATERLAPQSGQAVSISLDPVVAKLDAVETAIKSVKTSVDTLFSTIETLAKIFRELSEPKEGQAIDESSIVAQLTTMNATLTSIKNQLSKVSGISTNVKALKEAVGSRESGQSAEEVEIKDSNSDALLASIDRTLTSISNKLAKVSGISTNLKDLKEIIKQKADASTSDKPTEVSASVVSIQTPQIDFSEIFKPFVTASQAVNTMADSVVAFSNRIDALAKSFANVPAASTSASEGGAGLESAEKVAEIAGQSAEKVEEVAEVIAKIEKTSSSSVPTLKQYNAALEKVEKTANDIKDFENAVENIKNSISELETSEIDVKDLLEQVQELKAKLSNLADPLVKEIKDLRNLKDKASGKEAEKIQTQIDDKVREKSNITSSLEAELESLISQVKAAEQSDEELIRKQKALIAAETNLEKAIRENSKAVQRAAEIQAKREGSDRIGQETAAIRGGMGDSQKRASSIKGQLTRLGKVAGNLEKEHGDLLNFKQEKPGETRSFEERILRQLLLGNSSVKELAGELSTTQKAVETAVKTMHADGKVAKDESGKFGLSTGFMAAVAKYEDTKTKIDKHTRNLGAVDKSISDQREVLVNAINKPAELKIDEGASSNFSKEIKEAIERFPQLATVFLNKGARGFFTNKLLPDVYKGISSGKDIPDPVGKAAEIFFNSRIYRDISKNIPPINNPVGSASSSERAMTEAGDSCQCINDVFTRFEGVYLAQMDLLRQTLFMIYKAESAQLSDLMANAKAAKAYSDIHKNIASSNVGMSQSSSSGMSSEAQTGEGTTDPILGNLSGIIQNQAKTAERSRITNERIDRTLNIFNNETRKAQRSLLTGDETPEEAASKILKNIRDIEDRGTGIQRNKDRVSEVVFNDILKRSEEAKAKLGTSFEIPGQQISKQLAVLQRSELQDLARELLGNIAAAVRSQRGEEATRDIASSKFQLLLDRRNKETDSDKIQELDSELEALMEEIEGSQKNINSFATAIEQAQKTVDSLNSKIESANRQITTASKISKVQTRGAEEQARGSIVFEELRDEISSPDSFTDVADVRSSGLSQSLTNLINQTISVIANLDSDIRAFDSETEKRRKSGNLSEQGEQDRAVQRLALSGQKELAVNELKRLQEEKAQLAALSRLRKSITRGEQQDFKAVEEARKNSRKLIRTGGIAEERFNKTAEALADEAGKVRPLSESDVKDISGLFTSLNSLQKSLPTAIEDRRKAFFDLAELIEREKELALEGAKGRLLSEDFGNSEASAEAAKERIRQNADRFLQSESEKADQDIKGLEGRESSVSNILDSDQARALKEAAKQFVNFDSFFTGINKSLQQAAVVANMSANAINKIGSGQLKVEDANAVLQVYKALRKEIGYLEGSIEFFKSEDRDVSALEERLDVLKSSARDIEPATEALNQFKKSFAMTGEIDKFSQKVERAFASAEKIAGRAGAVRGSQGLTDAVSKNQEAQSAKELSSDYTSLVRTLNQLEDQYDSLKRAGVAEESLASIREKLDMLQQVAEKSPASFKILAKALESSIGSDRLASKVAEFEQSVRSMDLDSLDGSGVLELSASLKGLEIEAGKTDRTIEDLAAEYDKISDKGDQSAIAIRETIDQMKASRSEMGSTIGSIREQVEALKQRDAYLKASEKINQRLEGRFDSAMQKAQQFFNITSKLSAGEILDQVDLTKATGLFRSIVAEAGNLEVILDDLRNNGQDVSGLVQRYEQLSATLADVRVQASSLDNISGTSGIDDKIGKTLLQIKEKYSDLQTIKERIAQSDSGLVDDADEKDLRKIATSLESKINTLKDVRNDLNLSIQKEMSEKPQDEQGKQLSKATLASLQDRYELVERLINENVRSKDILKGELDLIQLKNAEMKRSTAESDKFGRSIQGSLQDAMVLGQTFNTIFDDISSGSLNTNIAKAALTDFRNLERVLYDIRSQITVLEGEGKNVDGLRSSFQLLSSVVDGLGSRYQDLNKVLGSSDAESDIQDISEQLERDLAIFAQIKQKIAASGTDEIDRDSEKLLGRLAASIQKRTEDLKSLRSGLIQSADSQFEQSYNIYEQKTSAPSDELERQFTASQLVEKIYERQIRSTESVAANYSNISDEVQKELGLLSERNEAIRENEKLLERVENRLTKALFESEKLSVSFGKFSDSITDANDVPIIDVNNLDNAVKIFDKIKQEIAQIELTIDVFAKQGKDVSELTAKLNQLKATAEGYQSAVDLMGRFKSGFDISDKSSASDIAQFDQFQELSTVLDGVRSNIDSVDKASESKLKSLLKSFSSSAGNAQDLLKELDNLAEENKKQLIVERDARNALVPSGANFQALSESDKETYNNSAARSSLLQEEALRHTEIRDLIESNSLAYSNQIPIIEMELGALSKRNDLLESAQKLSEKIAGASATAGVISSKEFKPASAFFSEDGDLSAINSEIESLKIADQQYASTAKSIQKFKIEIAKLESQGLDSSKLKTELEQLENSVKGVSVSFGPLAKALEAAIGAEDFSKTVSELEKDLENLGDASADLSVLSDIFKQVNKDSSGLDKTIAKLEIEYRKLTDKTDGAAVAMRETIDRMKEIRAQTRGQLFGENFLKTQKLMILAEDLGKLEDGIADLQTTASRQSVNKDRARQQIKSPVAEDRLQGVDTLRRTGNEARTAVETINEYLFNIRDLEKATGSLSDEQKEQIETLEKLRAQFEGTSAEVKRAGWQMKVVEKSAISAGQAFEMYTQQIADSARQAFGFVHAVTIVASVVQGLRASFGELVNSAKAFARTMTVMQSTSMTMEQIYKRLTQTVTDTAITYGKSVEEVSEVLKQFGSAGLTAEEAFRALDSTMKTLIATQADGEQIARAISGIYSIYGDQLSKTGGDMAAFAKINDVLTSVYQNHQVELDEMVQGLKFAASSGKLAGFSFQETSAFLAVLNDNMLKSGMAGRSLNAVFAQIAAKSGEIEKTFGFKFDSNKTIQEQFVPFLEDVRGKIGEGIIKPSDLDKQFKFFDRQGAKGFQMLVMNIDKVKEAIVELNEKAGGLSSELSSIVRNDFATQFERMKQALLAIGKDFVEPIKGAVEILGDIAVGFREFMKIDPLYLATIAKWIGVIAFVAIALSTTVVSVVLILSTFITKLMEVVGAAAIVSKSLWSLAKSFFGVGAASQTAAATIRTSSMLISTSLGIVGAILLAVGATMAYFSDSTAKVSKDMAQLTGEIKQLDREIDSLNKFEKKIDAIARAADANAYSHEIMGQRIKNAYDQAGDKVTSYGIIVGKTNAQIGADIKNIVARTREQIAVVKEAQRVQMEGKRAEQRDRIITGVAEAASESGVLGTQIKLLDPSSSKDLFGYGRFSKQKNEEINKEFIKTTKDFNEKISTIIGEALSSNAISYEEILELIDKETKKLQKESLETENLKRAAGAALGGTKTALVDPTEQQNLVKILEAYRQKITELNTALKDTEAIEIFDATTKSLIETLEAMGTPGTELGLISSAANEAQRLNKILTETDDGIRRILALNSMRVSLADMPVVSANVALDKDVVLSQTREVFATLPGALKEDQKLRDSLRDAFPEVEINWYSANLDEISEALSNQVLIIGDAGVGYNNVNVSLDKATKLTKVLTDLTGETVEGGKTLNEVYLTNLQMQTRINNAIKLRAQLLKTELDAIDQTARVSVEFNELGREDLEFQIDKSALGKLFEEANGLIAEASQEANLGIAPIQINLEAIDKTNYAGLLSMGSQVRAQIEYIQSATGGVFEGSDDGEPGGEKGEDTAIKKRNERLGQLVKKYAEIQQKIGGNVEKAQQMLEKEFERIRANETINKKLSLHRRNQKSEYNLAKQRVELAKLNLSQETKALELSQELVKDERKRLAAQTKINEIQLEINEAQEDANEKRHEENLTIFDTLEKIEKIRASLKFPGDSLASQFAGAGDKLMGLAYNISQMEKKYKDLYNSSGLFTGNQSEAIKLVEEYADILEGVADFYQMRDDAIKKQRDKEQEINDVLKERLSIYKEIEDFLKGQADSGAKIAQDAVKRQFDIETSQNEGSFLPKPTKAAILLARQFGANVEDVTLNIDRYIERYVELLKTPGAQFDSSILKAFKGLAPEVDKSLSSVEKFGNKVKDVSKLNRELVDSQMKFYESQFNSLYSAKFDDKGKLKEDVTFTEEDAKRLESYASQYQGMIDKNRQNPNLVIDADEILRQLTLAASLREKIEAANEVLLTQETQKVKFIIEWLNSDIFDNIKKDAESKLKDLRATLRVNVQGVGFDQGNRDGNDSQITNLENFLRDGTLIAKAFEGLISDIVQISSKTSRLKNHEGADDPLESQSRLPEYYERLIRGYATGGRINGPGTSTSDSILARLSNGEYVVKASAVQHYGTSFLDSVNSKRLKAFSTGSEGEGEEVKAAVSGLPSVGQLLVILETPVIQEAATTLLTVADILQPAAVALQTAAVTLEKAAVKDQGASEQVARAVKALPGPADTAASGAQTFNVESLKKEMDNLFKKAAEFFEKAFKKGEKDLTDANEALEEAKKGTEKAKPADIKAKRIKDGQESGIYKTLMQIGKMLQSFGSAIFKSIENILNLSFVIENIEALKTYRERVSEIGKTFEEQIGGIEKALKRNESSYFDYLNSLQDAEEERLKSLLDAEKQYQEQLKKTAEVAEETFSNMFKGVASFGGDQISSAFDSLSEKAFEKGAEFFGTLANPDVEVKNNPDGTTTAVPSSTEGPGFIQRLDKSINKITGAFAPSGKTDWKPIETLTGALKSVGGWIAEKLSFVTDKIVSAFSKIADVIGGFVSGFAERVSSLASGLTDLMPGKMIADAVAASPMLSGVASMAGGGLLSAAGAIAGPLAGIVGEGIGLATKDPEEFQKFIDEFIAQLPEVAEKFISTVVEALPQLIEALSEMMPVLFTTIAEALPELLMMIANQLPILLESFITALIDSLPMIVEALIKALTVGILKVLVVLVKGLAKLMSELPNIIIGLIKGLIEGLLEVLLDPSFWIELGKAIIKLMLFPLFTILDWFGLPTFHTGGVIPGNANDVPIIAQGGEGVLSREGMLALGGAQNLDKLNSGVNPFIEDINRYHSGGVVGEAMTRDAIISRQPSVSSSSVSTNNNISVNVTINGSMDSRQIDQMTNKLVNEIDGKLSKKVQDRDSRLARSMANRK